MLFFLHSNCNLSLHLTNSEACPTNSIKLMNSSINILLSACLIKESISFQRLVSGSTSLGCVETFLTLTQSDCYRHWWRGWPLHSTWPMSPMKPVVPVSLSSTPDLICDSHSHSQVLSPITEVVPPRLPPPQPEVWPMVHSEYSFFFFSVQHS